MNTGQQAWNKWSDSCAFSAFLWLLPTGIVPATQTMFLFHSIHSEFNFRFHFAKLRDKHRHPTPSESAWLQKWAWKLSCLHPSPWQSPSILHWLAQKSRTSARPTWPSSYEIISSQTLPLSALVGCHLKWSRECGCNMLERVKLGFIRENKDEETDKSFTMRKTRSINAEGVWLCGSLKQAWLKLQRELKRSYNKVDSFIFVKLKFACSSSDPHSSITCA